MNEAKRKLLGSALKLLDLGAVILALVLAGAATTPHMSRDALWGFLSIQIRCSQALVFLLALVVWHWILVMCRLYESKRLSRKLDMAKELVLASFLITISVAWLGYVAHVSFIDPRYIEVFWFFSASLLLGSHALIYYALGKIRRRGRNLRHILILGTNARATAFADRIRSTPQLGYRVVGFVDTRQKQAQGKGTRDSAICCDFAGLEEFLRWHVVDEIALYLPLRSFYEHAAAVATVCEQHGIILRIAPDLFNLRVARAQSDDFDGEPQITSVTGSAAAGPLLVKRSLDFVLSLALIVLLWPVFLVLALLVKATSPGPILFRQTRLGLHRRQFVMYKFRTMVQEAEKLQDTFASRNEMNGPVFKIRDDPRVTPIGRILRKTSLDELPQLWNVLRGEMSLVGPRAMSMRDYRLFPQDWQRRRFSVQPGLTCLWQINGRSSVPFDAWMKMDLEYIDSWSLWLDLKILAKTVPVVLRGVGAA